MSQSQPQNPYIGPRPFQVGETLYGRDREILELLDLLIAERIALLYSPSGAGKTSLIQAGLLPELTQEDFHVLPVIRVSLESTPQQANDLPSGCNRYVLSALMSLEEVVPTEKQFTLNELAGMTLDEYLARRHDIAGLFPTEKLPALRGEQRIVLIFDQFEEILTIDPTDRSVKTAFFAQLGAVLRNFNVYALIAMREEFPAGLDPYLKLLPTRLSTTFRLELLGVEAACQAIREPAQQAGIPFTDTAADKLIDDLRTVRVQQPDGITAKRPGLYIEPVQLQVVCFRLWDYLPKGSAEIGENHIQEAGNVNTALAGYYADRIRIIAEQTDIRERTIREWFDRHLITEQGIRGQALRGVERSQGLANSAIAPLVDAHLVRAENRRGATWYELAHDRLIEPVRQNNEHWFQTRLSLLQHQAALWNEQHRSQSLLFHDNSLDEAEQWANGHQEELNSVEQEFLFACQKARTQQEKERFKNRLIRGLAIISAIISLLAVFASCQSYSRKKEAERLGAISVAQSLAVQSLYRQEAGQREVAALLARQAYLFNRRNQGELLSHIDNALRNTLNVTHFSHTFHLDTNALSVALSSDGQTLAAGDNDGKIYVWNLTESNSAPRILRGHKGAVWSLAIDSERMMLASGGSDTTIRIWDLKALNADPLVLSGHDGIVFAVSFHPKNRTLASGSLDRTVRLWNLTYPEREPIVLRGHTRSVNTVAFSPDKKTLASGSSDQTIRLWHLENLKKEPEILSGHEGSVNSIAFDPTGRFLASGSADLTVRLWNLLDSQASPAILRGHTETVFALTFDAAGRHLLSSGQDRALRVWDVDSPDAGPLVLRGHEETVFALTSSSDAPFAASAGQDNSVRLWEMGVSAHATQVLKYFKLNARSFDELRSKKMPETLVTALQSLKNQEFTLRNMFLKAVEEKIGKTETAEYREALLEHAHSQRPDIMALTFTADDRTLLSLNSAGIVQRRSLNRPDISPTTLLEFNDNFTVGDFSPDGNWLALGSENGSVRVWDLNTPDAQPLCLTGHTAAVKALSFSPDSRNLASGSEDESIRIWNLNDANAEAIVLEKEEGPIFALAFSPDGKTLASGSGNSISQRNQDSRVRLWNMRKTQPDSKILGYHKRPILALAFSPDGKTMASGSADRTILLWDVKNFGLWSALEENVIDFLQWITPLKLDESPRCRELSGHGGAVRSLKFSPDGKTLFSCGADNTMRLWEVQSPRANPIIFRDDKNGVGVAAFSREGSSLVSGANDGELIIRTMPDMLADMVCRKVRRNLTPEEWNHFVGQGIPYEETCPELK